MSEQVRDGWFVRAAARVGDLGSPFYEEEYQRDTWNEASAIGLQLLVWLLPVIAVVSVWVGGAPAVPYALAMVLAPGAVSWVVVSYAGARGVDSVSGRGITHRRWRSVALAVLLIALLAGIARAEGSSSETWGLLTGAVVGLLVAAGALVLVRRRARR